MNPLDYSLCSQTVTVYRKTGSRQMVENGYLSGGIRNPAERYGKSMEKVFLLIIPGDFPLEPGDRVYAGLGPETVDWNTFLPALVPELFEVSFAKPCFWEGEIVHWEAGHKKEGL